ncbi:MAG: hypothetical protein EA352_05180 [Gemmatimonadales bacterium]|nr:MAG: hypothetical protein EA352_05180 [Gemmatimonadales bacterium]
MKLSALLAPLLLVASWGVPDDPCLALELGTWTPDLVQPADSIQFALPGRIRLAGPAEDLPPPHPTPTSDSTPGATPAAHPDDAHTEGAIQVPDGVLGSVHGHRRWEAGPDGNLLFSFREGGLRVQVELGRPDPEGHRIGSARGTRQVEGEVERVTEVTARAVDCGAPIPEEHAFRWEFPASLPLGTGDTLRLGGTVPSPLLVPVEEAPGAGAPSPIIRTPGVEERVLLGPEAASGILTGAGRIEVGLAPDGRVLHIDVVFPPEGNERRDLLDRMYHRFGDPTIYYAQTFAWDGRVVRLTFGSQVTGPGWVLRMSVRGDDLPTRAAPAP